MPITPTNGGVLDSLLHLLHRASQRAEAEFARTVSVKDLTSRQHVVLSAVAQRDGLSQTDIVAVTGIDRSGTAALVARLVRGGSLQRRRTRRDARAYSVRITALGREKLAAGSKAVRTADEHLTAGLSASQRTAFVNLLTRVAGRGNQARS